MLLDKINIMMDLTECVWENLSQSTLARVCAGRGKKEGGGVGGRGQREGKRKSEKSLENQEVTEGR